MIKDIVYKRFILPIKAELQYLKDKNMYLNSTCNESEFRYDRSNRQPIIFDRYKQAGNIDEHYFIQDIVMANKIIQNVYESKTTLKHYDIGSRVDGFIAHLLSASINVSMIDIRPLPICIENLEFLCADATDLKGIPDASIESISSLHAIEHFGLGRYGDDIDPNSWKKVLDSIVRVTKIGGMIYISVPIGSVQKLCFNAHRIFAINTIPDYLSGRAELVWCAHIKDYKVMKVNTELLSNYDVDGSYACGLYIFRKI